MRNIRILGQSLIALALVAGIAASGVMAQQQRVPPQQQQQQQPGARQGLSSVEQDRVQRFEQIGVPYISSGDSLSQQLSTGEGQERAVLLDVASREHYLNSHIQGAINVPSMELERVLPTVLPDRSTQILVYSSESRAGDALLASTALIRMGYTNIRAYGGSPEEAGLPVSGRAHQQGQAPVYQRNNQPIQPSPTR